jgi:eukaryotic-like serine/threonine-protein kinase
VSRRAARATVDAVVETTAYRVVDASGGAEAHPAVPGQRLRFQLRWSTGRWRVESISGPAG